MDRLAVDLGIVTPDAEGLNRLTAWLGELLDLCTAYTPVLLAFQAAAREQTSTAAGAGDVGQRLGEAILRSRTVTGDDPRRPSVDAADDRVGGDALGVLLAPRPRRGGPGGLPRRAGADRPPPAARRRHRGEHDGHGEHPRATRTPSGRRAPAHAGAHRRRPGDAAARPGPGQRLVDAGIATLPVLGYHETRVDDIVEAAGVSHGTFYRYFDSKDVLFQVLAAEAATRMVDLLAVFPEASARGSVDDESLLAWLRSWFGTYRDNGGILSAWQEIGAHDPQLASFSTDVAAVAFDRLRPHRGPPGLRQPDRRRHRAALGHRTGALHRAGAGLRRRRGRHRRLGRAGAARPLRRRPGLNVIRARSGRTSALDDRDRALGAVLGTAPGRGLEVGRHLVGTIEAVAVVVALVHVGAECVQRPWPVRRPDRSPLACARSRARLFSNNGVT